MLPGPGSYCLPHDMPINREVVGARNSNFIQKRQQTEDGVLVPHLTEVRIQTYTESGEGWFMTNLLLLESFLLAAVHRLGHDIPVNLQ